MAAAIALAALADLGMAADVVPVFAVVAVACSGSQAVQLAADVHVGCEGDLSLAMGVVTAGSAIRIETAGFLTLSSLVLSAPTVHIPVGGSLTLASSVTFNGGTLVINMPEDQEIGGVLRVAGPIAVAGLPALNSSSFITIVPEPSAYWMLAAGLLLLALHAQRPILAKSWARHVPSPFPASAAVRELA